MPKFHFFTELNILSISDEKRTFGPVSMDQFQTVTLFETNNSTLKAFSIGRGQIRYQIDNSDSSLLNCILKLNEPCALKGLPLKYIIYRGIRKDSLLLSSNPDDFIDHSSLPNNHIISKILDNGALPEPEYLSLGLGIKHSTTDSNEMSITDQSSIDFLFNNQYNFPAYGVKAGDILGEFQFQPSGSSNKHYFGIELVLESSWNSPDMEWVRNSDLGSSGNGKIIDITSLTGNTRQAEKEKCLNFMDPICLWSHLFQDGLMTDQGDKSENTLYQDILQTTYNYPHRIYLDLRDESGFSWNFYSRYTKGIAFKNVSSNQLEETIIATQGWPLVIIDNYTPLGGVSSSNFVKNISASNKTEIEISFPVDTNTKKLAFIACGRQSEESAYPVELVQGNRFRDLSEEASANASGSGTYPVTKNLKISGFQANISSLQEIGGYFKIFYIHQDITIPNDVESSSHYLDKLFEVQLLSSYPILDSQAITNSVFFGSLKYISDNSNTFGLTHPGMYQTGIGIDQDRVIFFACALELENSRNKISRYPAQFVSGKESFFKAISSDGDGDFKVRKVEVVTSSSTFQTLEISQNWFGRSWEKLFKKFRNYDNDTFLAVTLTINEYAQIESSISSYDSYEHPVFLKVSSDNFMDTSTNGYNYSNAQFNIDGLDINGNYISNILSPTFHSIDGRLYCTEAAAQAETIDLQTTSYGICISHNPNSTDPNEVEAFHEINEALKRGRRFVPELFKELDAITILGHKTYYGIWSENNGAQYDGTNTDLRTFTINVGYTPIGSTGATSVNPKQFTINGNTFNSLNKIGSITNHSKYEELALKDEVHYKNPEEIAEGYSPEFNFTDKNGNESVKTVSTLTEKGHGEIEPIITISLNESIRSNFTDQDYSATYPDELPEVDFSPRQLLISHVIVHELGHALYNIKNPLLNQLWTKLSANYPIQDSDLYDETDPYKSRSTGGGHLEGHPSGNTGCYMESLLGKRWIIDNVWREMFSSLVKFFNNNPQQANDMGGGYYQGVCPPYLKIYLSGTAFDYAKLEEDLGNFTNVYIPKST